MTKYERAKAMEEARAKHESNIKELTEKMSEAKHLLAAIPNKGFDNSRERLTVKEEIRKIADFLADEKAAYKATFEDEETANSVISKLGI